MKMKNKTSIVFLATVFLITGLNAPLAIGQLQRRPAAPAGITRTPAAGTAAVVLRLRSDQLRDILRNDSSAYRISEGNRVRQNRGGLTSADVTRAQNAESLLDRNLATAWARISSVTNTATAPIVADGPMKLAFIQLQIELRRRLQTRGSEFIEEQGCERIKDVFSSQLIAQYGTSWGLDSNTSRGNRLATPGLKQLQYLNRAFTCKSAGWMFALDREFPAAFGAVLTKLPSRYHQRFVWMASPLVLSAYDFVKHYGSRSGFYGWIQNNRQALDQELANNQGFPGKVLWIYDRNQGVLVGVPSCQATSNRSLCMDPRAFVKSLSPEGLGVGLCSNLGMVRDGLRNLASGASGYLCRPPCDSNTGSQNRMQRVLGNLWPGLSQNMRNYFGLNCSPNQDPTSQQGMGSAESIEACVQNVINTNAASLRQPDLFQTQLQCISDVASGRGQEMSGMPAGELCGAFSADGEGKSLWDIIVDFFSGTSPAQLAAREADADEAGDEAAKEEIRKDVAKLPIEDQVNHSRRVGEEKTHRQNLKVLGGGADSCASPESCGSCSAVGQILTQINQCTNNFIEAALAGAGLPSRRPATGTVTYDRSRFSRPAESGSGAPAAEEGGLTISSCFPSAQSLGLSFESNQTACSRVSCAEGATNCCNEGLAEVIARLPSRQCLATDCENTSIDVNGQCFCRDGSAGTPPPPRGPGGGDPASRVPPDRGVPPGLGRPGR